MPRLAHLASLPALSWRCPLQLTKWLPAGAYVGYGCTYRCPAPTRIAVLPVGYFDGYPRMLSGRAHVLVNGAFAVRDGALTGERSGMALRHRAP